MSNALQGNLSDIDTAEADALSDLELQRSQTEIDYNNAIAQAKAEGNYQLAQQLYTEKVRVDEALREQMAQAAQQQLAQQQMAMQQSQQSWENQFAMDKYQSGLEQQDYQNMLALAQEMAAYGDFSGYQALGIDTSTMEQRYAQELEADNAKKYSSRSGGTSGGAGGMTLTTAKAAAESGYFGDEVLNVLRKNGYSDGMLTAIYGYEPTSYGNETGGQALSAAAQNILNSYRNVNPGTGANVPAVFAERIKTALNNGQITERDADYLLSVLGY